MDNIKKSLTIALIVVALIAIVFVYLYFTQKDVIYNPMENPHLIEVIKQDSIDKAQFYKSLDSIGGLYSLTQHSIDSIRDATNRKLNSLGELFIKWKSEKERISKLTEKELEAEINNILEQSH